MGPALNIADGEPVGLLAIDFAGRRRVRVNGTVIAVAADGFDVAVDQAFGNCPRYIEQRRLVHAEPPVDARVVRSNALSADQVALITRSDTFFLGTVHPQRGADASHRGGPPGFVHVDGDRLWWPDYPGNNMFNSLGNLAVDPSAALLFIDFDTGATLHLSGSAVLDWSDAASDDGGTGRRVHFTVESVAAGTSALRGERLFSRRP
jgi:predicted pyridoxine 5'-phosphate oxidase superfamily flavin-nucleotide-binding protein